MADFLVWSLILYPFITAIVLFLTPSECIRSLLVKASTFLIIAVTLVLCVTTMGAPLIYLAPIPHLSTIFLALDGILTVAILWYSIRNRRILPVLFTLAQLAMLIYVETTYGHQLMRDNSFYVDRLSLIMAGIIGIVGTLICLYAVGYMRDYHHHYPKLTAKPTHFFALLFVFLSSMYGVVFANHLMFLYTFWELTTICSVLLIGYTRTEEAIQNSFLALNINLFGGVAFMGGIILLYRTNQIILLQDLLATRGVGIPVLVIGLISMAAFTKAAQLPFSQWLLGAMVAPTPTSALLHSSTMVKAGIFLFIKLAPLYAFNVNVGFLVAGVGGLTFLIASLISIAEQNMKKLLAYSTIANLGLMVFCAGIGTAEFIWIAIFLLIFHAVAKSMLFLAVGTVENALHTKEIENMDALLARMPKLANIFILGIVSLAIVPFGLVVFKWMTIENLAQINSWTPPFFLAMLAFGSAATIYYWGKLLGKLVAFKNLKSTEQNLEASVPGTVWFSLYAHGALNIALCFLFPLLSSSSVDLYLTDLFGHAVGLPTHILITIYIALAIIIVVPALLSYLRRNNPIQHQYIYMSGRNVDEQTAFPGSLGRTFEVTTANYYLERYFNNKVLTNTGIALTALLLVALYVVGLLQ